MEAERLFHKCHDFIVAGLIGGGELIDFALPKLRGHGGRLLSTII